MGAFQIQQLATLKKYLFTSYVRIFFFCDSCRMTPKCHRLRVIPQPKGNKSGIKNKIFTLNTLKLFHLTYMTRAFLEISSDIHVLRYFLGFFKLTTKFCKCVVRRDDTKYPFSENHPYMWQSDFLQVVFWKFGEKSTVLRGWNLATCMEKKT